VRDLHNIERIEVLKGPAAVLYGRGSQGGIVSRVSKAPQPGRESFIEAQTGSWDLRSVYGDPDRDDIDDRARSFRSRLAYTLAPDWHVLMGVRLERFSVDSTNRLLDASASHDSSGVSPQVGVVWTPVRDHPLYASYSKTFSPTGGGTIGITPNARGNTNDLDPEHTRQTEVGGKSDWLDGQPSTTLALYQLELYNPASRLKGCTAKLA
jgi:outer membrane receptor protein involved in Fe transport